MKRLVRGVVWRASQLKPGEFFVVETGSTTYASSGVASLKVCIARAQKAGLLRSDYTYVVDACIGHTADLTEPPFRFLRIKCLQNSIPLSTPS